MLRNINKNANNIATIIKTFLDGYKTVERLNNYYRKNIKAITMVKSLDEGIHQELIDAFKSRKQEILNGQPVT
tara:strand:- start:2630 stop:2848 length:219 start_codon:yes stop_codon:yes gene_type:complete